MSLREEIDHTTWPTKTREVQNHLQDSTLWSGVRFRQGDIVIASWGKSGMTWTQQIVGQLIFKGAADVSVAALSPWVEMRMTADRVHPMLEAQVHRRFLKSHLPVEALPFMPEAKYIYVARDGRDAAWSAYHHLLYMKQDRYDPINAKAGATSPPTRRPQGSVHEFWRDWCERDGYPFWPFWQHIRGWWGGRDLPNVRLLHFNELKHDLAGSIRSLAEFLDIEIEEANFPAILEHCSFEYMKAHAELMAPQGGVGWEGGGSTFIHKGTNGRWRDVLSPEECAAYEARAVAELGPACAHWLKTGERLAGAL